MSGPTSRAGAHQRSAAAAVATASNASPAAAAPASSTTTASARTRSPAARAQAGVSTSENGHHHHQHHHHHHHHHGHFGAGAGSSVSAPPPHHGMLATTTTTSATTAHGGSSRSIWTCRATDRWDIKCTNAVIGAPPPPSEHVQHQQPKKGKRAAIAQSASQQQQPHSAYCEQHAAELDVLKKDFEADVKAFQQLDPNSVCFDGRVIATCKSLAKLEQWEKAARDQLLIAEEIQGIIQYLSSNFGIDDRAMAALNVEVVNNMVAQLRGNLDTLVRRMYIMILTSEDALWLVPLANNTNGGSDGAHTATGGENGKSSSSTTTTTGGTVAAANQHTGSKACIASSSPSPLRPLDFPPPVVEAEEPNPVRAKAKARRTEILELLSLTGSHASFIKDTRTSVERVRIVEGIFRKLIARDEALLVRAYRSRHDHVLRMFEDVSCCSTADLARLWQALQACPVELIKEAIVDAFRAMRWEESGATETEEGEEGRGMQLIGGWLYRHRLAQRMDRVEWNHLYALCGCAGCALRCCHDFDEWAANRRLTVVPQGRLSAPYIFWGEVKESDAARVFRALDIVKCCENRMTAEIENRRGPGARSKSLFVEKQDRNWIFVKISVAHPKARAILSALSDKYAILSRDRRDADTVLEYSAPGAHLWDYRSRSSPNKTTLRHQAWRAELDSFGRLDQVARSFDALETPESAQGIEPFRDVYEVVILDAYGREGEGAGKPVSAWIARSFERFEAEVGLLMLDVFGCADVKAALAYGENESYRLGDMVKLDESALAKLNVKGDALLTGGAAGDATDASATALNALAAAGYGYGLGGGAGALDTGALQGDGASAGAITTAAAAAINSAAGKGKRPASKASPAKDKHREGSLDALRKYVQGAAAAAAAQQQGGDGTQHHGQPHPDAAALADAVLGQLRDDELAYKLSQSLFR